MANKIGEAALKRRLEKMKAMRDEYCKDIENVHVKIQKGNSKTGANCYTVSLIPILDCGKNCKECSRDCYDIRNDCWMPVVQNDRARNSAIHLMDIERYWNEISIQLKSNFVQELRINVGGDLRYEDFKYVNNVAKENPKCDILFFTKSYEDVNRFLDENEFESNIQCIFSAWKNTKMDNPYSLPTSHVLYENGETTAPQYGSYYCGGNCSECHFNEEGCWTLNRGESVIFKEH